MSTCECKDFNPECSVCVANRNFIKKIATPREDAYGFIVWLHNNCKRIQMSFDEQKKAQDSLTEVIADAERRGFERARNLAINWFAKNGYEALKMDIENLKYEEA